MDVDQTEDDDNEDDGQARGYKKKIDAQLS